MRCLETSTLRKTGLFILGVLLLPALRAADPPDHVPGRLLAVSNREVDTDRMTRAFQLHGARLHKQIPALALNVLDVPEESSEAVMESLRQSGMFAYVERDYYAHLANGTTPNDPSFANQWYLPQISAPQAWSISTGSPSIVVAVIDSGVDGTHPDLAPKLVPGWNFVANSANTTDLVGHGTAVAGTVAAASNNNIGIAGVSWNSQIMPLVVVDTNEYASYSNIAAAIQYAVDHGAGVINISIGGTSSSSVLQSAVDYAWGKNVVIFASAMNNSSSTPNYPAACNHAIAVSATDSTDSLAYFSNYGSWIAVAAPGTNILTTVVGGGYGYWYGTSFSSPIATGVASLALAVNPSLTAPALVSLLEQNTDDLGTPGFDTSFGWGRVNAYKVLTAVQPPPSVTTAPLTASLNAGQTQQFTASVVGTTNTAVTWSVSPALGSISAAGLYTAPATVAAPQTVTVTAAAVGGATGTATVTLVPVKVTASPLTASLSGGQTQQFAAAVTGTTNTTVAWSLSPTVGSISAAGLYTAPATVAAPQTVTITATAATGAAASSTISLVPVKVTVSPLAASMNAGQTQQFTATVTGTTNTTVIWSLSPAVGSIAWATGLYTAPASIASVQTVTVTATAVNGATASATLTLVPVKVTVSPLTASLNTGQTQQFTATITGTTNTAATWTLSPAVGSISSTGVYTAPASIASAQTVTITATAANGTTTSATLTLVPVKVTVSPLTASLNAGQTQQFTATVTGTTNTAVTWSLSPAVGSVSSTGLYTAPASVTANQSVTVTATGANGATASAAITLVPVTVTISPLPTSLNTGQTQQFTATVTGTTNTAVTWSLSPAVGSVSSTGLYTAPVSIVSSQTVKIIATTANGTAGFATFTVLPATISNSTFSPIRVNAGGPNYVDTLGQTWSADYGFTGGNTWSNGATVPGNAAPVVYQTCRWGAFSYAFVSPNGSYTVNLKFAEPSLGGAGQRLFNVSINGTTVLNNFDVYAAAGGMMIAVDKSFPVTVTNGQINIQFTAGTVNWPMVSGIEILQSQTHSQSTFTPIRVNASGPAYVDTLNQAWSADYGFTGGNTWSNSGNISGTPSPVVYQTCRWGAFNYGFTVPNGSYTVNLKFAEISLNGPGQRLFNAAINGTAVLTNFDIYAAAGGMMIAIDKPFPVTVTNGQINIQFTAGSVDWPLVSGIEILPATGVVGSVPIRVNSSGPVYTDSKGQTWVADTGFAGGNTWSNSGAIAGTSDPTLYQTCRWGSFSYVFAVPNGAYTVNLKFAEISRTAVGQRQFNVAIDGTPVLTNFDIVAAAGAPMTAIDKPFQITVATGQVVLLFTAGAADLPLINAIEIVPASTSSSTTGNAQGPAGQRVLRKRP